MIVDAVFLPSILFPCFVSLATFLLLFSALFFLFCALSLNALYCSTIAIHSASVLPVFCFICFLSALISFSDGFDFFLADFFLRAFFMTIFVLLLLGNALLTSITDAFSFLSMSLYNFIILVSVSLLNICSIFFISACNIILNFKF